MWQDEAGNARAMPIHGLARDTPLSVEEPASAGSAGAIVTLLLDSSTLRGEHVAKFTNAYGARSFSILVTYVVSRGVLTIAHIIRNKAKAAAADGGGAGGGAAAAGGGAAGGGLNLPYAFGNHLSLKFPFTARGTWEGGRLRGKVNSRALLSPESLLTGELRPEPGFDSEDGVALTTPGVTDGVYCRDPANPGYWGGGPRGGGAPLALSLTESETGVCVEVTHGMAMTDEGGKPAACDWAAMSARRCYVLWGRAPSAGAPGYMCTEPWTAGPNALNSKTGLAVLAPGQAAVWTITITPSGRPDEA